MLRQLANKGTVDAECMEKIKRASEGQYLILLQPFDVCCGAVQLAILVMIAGAIIAGITDLTFSLPGYIWVAICAVSTAAYLLLIKYLKDESGAQLRLGALCQDFV